MATCDNKISNWRRKLVKTAIHKTGRWHHTFVDTHRIRHTSAFCKVQRMIATNDQVIEPVKQCIWKEIHNGEIEVLSFSFFLFAFLNLQVSNVLRVYLLVGNRGLLKNPGGSSSDYSKKGWFDFGLPKQPPPPPPVGGWGPGQKKMG